jgi:hypothetical protein
MGFVMFAFLSSYLHEFGRGRKRDMNAREQAK